MYGTTAVCDFGVALLTGLQKAKVTETPTRPTLATRSQEPTTETAEDNALAPKVQKRKSPNTNTTMSRRATRSMTTDAARQAVLQTDELLDAILVNLSMQQLFVIQRVSKRFKAVIAATPAIQEKMFLRPSKGPAETWTIDEVAYMPVGLAQNIVGVRPVARRPVTLNPMVRTNDFCPSETGFG